jgi:hypothetical protein
MAELQEKIRGAFAYMQRDWDGKDCVEEMRDSGYSHWRQMEWIGFYFQMQCERLLYNVFTIPGDSYRRGSVVFDGKCEGVNFDFKAHSAYDGKGNFKGTTILNDKWSMEQSIQTNGRHGLILAQLRCAYDDSGDFRRWHQSIIGEKSKYVLQGEATGRKSRKRKISAKVERILVLTITKDSLQHLPLIKQGKNSDGSPRNFKYGLNTHNLGMFSPYEV